MLETISAMWFIIVTVCSPRVFIQGVLYLFIYLFIYLSIYLFIFKNSQVGHRNVVWIWQACRIGLRAKIWHGLSILQNWNRLFFSPGIEILLCTTKWPKSNFMWFLFSISFFTVQHSSNVYFGTINRLGLHKLLEWFGANVSVQFLDICYTSTPGGNVSHQEVYAVLDMSLRFRRCTECMCSESRDFDFSS